MSKESLELEKLKDWFAEKYGWSCHEQACEEWNRKNKNQSWFKKIFGDKNRELWIDNRTKEIFEDLWNKELRREIG